MKRKTLQLTVIPVQYSSNPTATEGKLLVNSCGPEINDSALISADNYKEIYGITRRENCRQAKIISLLKIKGNSYSIYRQYRYFPIEGLTNKVIGLTFDSTRLLEDSSNRTPNTVSVQKSFNFFAFYWNHPFHSTRISFKIGILSVALALISVVLVFCR